MLLGLGGWGMRCFLHMHRLAHQPRCTHLLLYMCHETLMLCRWVKEKRSSINLNAGTWQGRAHQQGDVRDGWGAGTGRVRGLGAQAQGRAKIA